jgi:hypothetical protein
MKCVVFDPPIFSDELITKHLPSKINQERARCGRQGRNPILVEGIPNCECCLKLVRIKLKRKRREKGYQDILDGR